MKPVVAYYGGKQKMARHIVPLLPRHTVYVEPFAGGAAIMFAKGLPPRTATADYRECLNDKKNDIINLYHVLRTPDLARQFVDRLQLTPYARMENFVAFEERGNLPGIGDKTGLPDLYAGLDPLVVRAIALYVRLQTSFANGGHRAGWGFSKCGRNHAATWINKVKSLPQYLDRLAEIHLENDDALSVIKRWDSPQTLFYCDPPYPDTHQGGYAGYTLADFHALCALLDTIKGSFVLSCYPQPGVPEHWERFEFATRASAAVDKTLETRRTEVVWRMDRSDSARSEIHKIWERWGWAKGQPMPQKT